MLVVKTQKEVEDFLREFMSKLNIWGITFFVRNKNKEALKILGLKPSDRVGFIKGLKTLDYSHTINDEYSYGDMWVFGKFYENTELYIKIAMGHLDVTLFAFRFTYQISRLIIP